MGKSHELLARILEGRSDANIRFTELRALLRKLGFAERISGSHHIYRKEGILEKLNVQEDGSKAKPYQVKQIRAAILKYNLTLDEAP